MNEGLNPSIESGHPAEPEITEDADRRYENGQINMTEARIASGLPVNGELEVSTSSSAASRTAETGGTVVPFRATRYAPTNGRRRTGNPSARPGVQLDMGDYPSGHDDVPPAA